MTKPLNTQLSQQDGPTPRSGPRIRTWLVALLGFGAADLLMLNLWAVPKLITTTDIRAAQSSEEQAAPSALEPEPQPMAAVVLPDQLLPAEAEGQPAEPAQPGAEAEPSEPAQAAVEPGEAAPPEPAHNDDAPEEAAQIAAPQPPAPPGHAQLPSEAYAPPDPSSAAPFAIRAALRAVRVALQDHAAASGTGPFAVSNEDQPFTQIYFSLGNFILGPNGKQQLERMLPQLTSDARPILIVGSADPSGSEQINEKLSDARAQSVAEWLLTHGIDAERIQTRAIGHEGAVGSTLDRRVDIWLGGSR